MMKVCSSTVALCLVLMSDAQAQERHYVETISGSGAPSSFDYDGDGVKGHYITFSGLTNFGRVHGGYLIEYDFLGAAPDAACPTGEVKLPVVVSSSNRAMLLQDGQIFMRDHAPSALYCLNPITGAFTMSVKGEFIGGLGTFAGATGSYAYKGSGRVLLQDSTGMPFGGFTLTTKGKIVLPR
jgi:hypothetical protein